MAAGFPQYRGWWADVLLTVLVTGFLAAPLMTVSGWQPLLKIADIAYAIGRWTCKQPELSMMVFGGYAMPLCMRSYGALAGVVMMRWLHGRTGGKGSYWLEQYGLWGFAATFIICLAYPLELALEGFPGWGMHYSLMLLFGIVAGGGLGAYLMPMIYGSRLQTGELGE